MNLSQALQVESYKVITAIGGGGKTSTLLTLANEFEIQRKKFFITTTTRVAARELAAFPVVYGKRFDELIGKIRLILSSRISVALGTELTSTGKVLGIPPEWIDKLKELYPDHYFLIEGDGAARKPFKAPGDFEPVIPYSTELVIGILGVEAIGQTLSEDNVHRADLVSGLTKVPLGDILNCDAIAEVIGSEQGYRKNVPEHSDFAVIINKVDEEIHYQNGKRLASLLLKRGISPVVLTALQTAEPIREVLY